MARILIADTPDGGSNLTRIFGPGHELFIAHTMPEATTALENHAFDLVVVGVHFDESRAFEFIPTVSRSKMNADKPLICFCSRDTAVTRVMHNSLEISSKALGAWMYLDQHLYNVAQSPDAELLRVFERCLTGEARKHTQAERLNIQAQRETVQQLRSDLLAEEWSLELEDRLGDLRQKLSRVLLELSKSQVDNVAQQEQVATSRGLHDRVSDEVWSGENNMAREERTQVLAETKQLVREQEIVEDEELKGKCGRLKLVDERVNES